MMSQAAAINDPKPNILVSLIMKPHAQQHNSRKPFLCVTQGALQASGEVDSESPSLKDNCSLGLFSCAEDASSPPSVDFSVRVQGPSKVCNVFNNIKIPIFRHRRSGNYPYSSCAALAPPCHRHPFDAAL